MKYLAVLGRLEKLSIAELESQFTEVEPLLERGAKLRQSSPKLATFHSNFRPDINRFGGVLKFAEELPEGSNCLIDSLANLPEGKITLGVSDFRHNATARTAQSEALKLKKILARRGRSIRVLENKTAVLSTATSHHNQLSEKKNHLEILLTDFGTFNLIGVQNITAYKNRDQARPARDAKVGMLPPKLAQILINLCGYLPEGSRLLDPFCGTGVVLQEAALLGYIPFGSDLNSRMVEYTEKNLDWLAHNTHHKDEFEADYFLDRVRSGEIYEGDATTFNWLQRFAIDAVASEVFLGQPMSQPPADIKLKQEKLRCKEIILGFLKNLAPQIGREGLGMPEPSPELEAEGRGWEGTPVVLAVPAWLRPNGTYSRLNILDEVEKLGYNVKKFINVGPEDLLYYREGQIVARDIIVLRKK
ncbi:hypothetical protein IKE71_02385 [Candidatus Saccharibacteria bacterium]|nr:hypothetical protein [Candidatus Saccharibacteria bacterium]